MGKAQHADSNAVADKAAHGLQLVAGPAIMQIPISMIKISRIYSKMILSTSCLLKWLTLVLLKGRVFYEDVLSFNDNWVSLQVFGL
jgi:hypothetical protein